MNPLDNMPEVRKKLYMVQWVLTGIQGLLGVYFAAQGELFDAPEWYTVGVLMLAFLWTYAGITAQSNVKVP